MKRTTTFPRFRILTASVGTLLGVAVLAGCSNAAQNPSFQASATPMQSAVSSESPAATGTPEINPPGDIPDNQAFVPFSPQGQPFTVSVPEGWARTGTPTLTTFTDKLNSVTIEAKQSATAPTISSVTGTEMAQVQTSATGYQAGETTEVTRNGDPVILTTFQADSAPDPVTGKSLHDDVQRYVYYKGGTEVVLTLSGPVGADNVDPWKKITDSLSWS